MKRRLLYIVTCAVMVAVFSVSDVIGNSYLTVSADPVENEAPAGLDISGSIAAIGMNGLKGGTIEPVRPKKIFLSEVKKLAVSKSKEYKKTKVSIITKKANYTDAVKRIAQKKKKLSTFSWMPLLNFNFPTDPGFTEEFEFNFKPVSIQSAITDLNHKLTDDLYSIYEKATNLYVKVYTLQENIKFNNKLLEARKKTLERNEGRLLLGLATQSDVDAIKGAITKLENQIATQETSFVNEKEKLKGMIGVDVRSNYVFENPYQSAIIERADLEALIQHTLDNSQGFFEAKSTTSLARTTLNQYYKQMLSKYGSHMDIVKKYVQAALNGEEVDGLALKVDFDALLKKIDEKWEGKLKILFIKIPKLWFKGATAGSRYIEDEPYALYNAILDYQSARLDQENLEKDIRSQVKDAYENVKALEKTYRNGVKELDQKARELEKALLKNQMGELTFAEYTELQEDFESTQLTVNEDLDSYTQALVSLDRLTCGGITAILKGDGLDSEDTVGGDSYLVAEIAEGVNYYIKVMLESNIFELGLHVPEDFEVSISKFELWVDNTKIGSSDPAKPIKHLGLILDGSETVFLRFYDDNGEMICDYTIDPSQYSGPVDIITGYLVKKREDAVKTIGTYTLQTNDASGTVTFTFKADESVEGAEKYKLLTSNGSVIANTDTPNGQGMTYLSLLQGSVTDITVSITDSNGKEIIKGKPDPETMTVKTEPEGGDAQ